ncbi:hypothetical protein CARUB_v10021879mg [Capsella rubella]|uniref:Uncharacterized protein n=1 Tax=Capsella rubella TaxID=81985 RepID=R0I8C3_9BRAS|nr:hypothetical protein CARUB_v10021879mg [Capsella rubella]
MSRTMEEYQSNESEENKGGWIWSKAVSVGKKVLTAGVVVSSAPLLVPSLVVASTIAFLSSVPFCLFLANYACTQKVMSSLLPPDTEETSGVDKDDESGFDEYSKIGHREDAAGVGEAALFRDSDEPVPIGVEEDKDMAKESTSLLEKIRDEGRNDRETSEKKDLQDDKKSGNDKSSEEVQDQPEKPEEPETGREGELGSTKTETSTGKDDEETSSNEVYSEDQIWEKMEALRKVVGYSVARSATYAEELQALYVFTGVVEPSRSSLNQLDTHDIAYVSLRLRFLMSAIGII